MSNPVYDISSAVQLQQNLIIDLSGMALNGNIAARNAIASINTQLGNVATSFGSANNAIYPALTYQDKVLTILDREKTRLENRKTAIDAAYDGQKRMVSLNDSAVAKQQSYNYMFMVIVLALLIYVGIRVLRSYQFVPDTLLDIITIVVLSGAAIYCIILFTDISHRSKMDFNQITLADPTKKDERAADTAGVSAGAVMLTPAAGNVCAAGTEFNDKYQVCIPTTVPYGTNISGLTNTNYGDYKIFANTNTSPVSFSWGNTKSECTDTTKPYNGNTLACEGFANMRITSALAQPYTPSEWESYSRY